MNTPAPLEQIREVVTRFDLRARLAPFTRGLREVAPAGGPAVRLARVETVAPPGRSDELRVAESASAK